MNGSRFFSRRLLQEFLWLVVLLGFGVGPMLASDSSAPGTTLVSDVVYRADGTPVRGTLVITWPAFTSVDNHAVAAGSKSVTIGAAGTVSVVLAPNEGAIPQGTSYKVVLKLDDGTTSTEYWIVPSASPVNISAIRSRVPSAIEKAAGRLVVPDPVGATDAANKRYVDGSGGEVKYADKFSGTTPEEKINAATVALAGKTGLVWVPPSMSGSYSQPNRMASKSLVVDFRGCYLNVYATEAECATSTVTGGAFWRQTVAEPVPSTAKTFVGFQIFQDVLSGGINQGLPVNIKSNFDSFMVSQRSYTPGQHQVFTSTLMNGSNGDTFGGGFQTYQYGSTDAVGDEGMKGLAVYSYQGSEEFGAIVSSVVGNVVNYTSAGSEFSRGEKRYLVVTNRGVYSTGTVSNIVNASVTGTGTSWASLCPSGTAPCDPTNLFFSLDGGNAASSQLYVIRVGHITSNTALTLAWDMDAAGLWQGDATSGTYKIYKGSTVTAVAKAGSVTVASGAQFQTADAIKMPLGNYLGIIGLGVQVKRFIPGGTTNPALYVNNIGPRQIPYAVSAYGNYATNIFLQNSNPNGTLIKSDGLATSGLHMYNTADNATLVPLRLGRNTGSGDFTLQFEKSTDTFSFVGAAKYKIIGTDATHVDFSVLDGPGVPRFLVKDSINGFPMGKPTYWWSDNQGVATAIITGSTGAAKFRDVTLTGAAQPACAASNRGQIWYTPGATGVKDSVSICVKNASDVYQWANLY